VLQRRWSLRLAHQRVTALARLSASPHLGIGSPPWPQPVVLSLAAAYLLLWIVTAVNPHDRFDWLLENLLVFVLTGSLVVTYRRFAFSTASYVSILAFLSFHAVGAFYTYSETPLGFWLQNLLGLARNHYDRLVHFAFGLLFAVPVRELLVHVTGLHGARASVAAFVCVLALSTGYELVEWWVAAIVSPEAAYAYLGTQGDVFDAQKDTTLAICGAALALVAVAGVHAVSRHTVRRAHRTANLAHQAKSRTRRRRT